MKSKIQNFLESKWFLPVVFTITTVLWACGQTLATLVCVALALLLQCVFCDNLVNIFGLIIFIPFFMEDLAVDASWIFYIVCISVAVLGMLYFVIKKLCFEKKRVTKGKMFWAWVVSMVAFMLGGIVGHFNYLATLAIVGIGLLTYFFYFLAVNFTNGLKDGLAYSFIVGSLFAFCIYFILIVRQGGGILYAIAHREFIWIGAENINTMAIFYCLAIISLFALGVGKKKDYLYFLLACVFEVFTFITYCRLMIFISAIVFVILFIVSIIKSPKRINYLWVILGLMGLAGLCFVIKRNETIDIVKGLFVKNALGTNGRNDLWSWCWNKFIENPIFGYGFVAYEPVPAIRDTVSIIIAHNTILQWLTSCGIIGIILLGYFYFVKYRLIFKGVNKGRFYVIVALIMMACSGMADQAIIMDFFAYIIPFFCLAIIECEGKTAPVISSGDTQISVEEKMDEKSTDSTVLHEENSNPNEIDEDEKTTKNEAKIEKRSKIGTQRNKKLTKK